MNSWREDILYTMRDTQGSSFLHLEYNSTTQNDHTHCSICFAKISGDVNCQAEKSGFYSKETDDWLCTRCFSDFKRRFDWSIQTT